MTKASRLALATTLWVAFCLLGFAGPAAAQKAPMQAKKANVETTQYDDWEVRCLKSNADECLMNQIVNNPSSDSPIMRVAMKYRPSTDVALMAFTLPLGTHLAPGLSVSVPGNKAIRIPYQVCFRNGCQAYLGLKSALMSKMKQGTSFQVTLVGPDGKKINLSVSLMGFTAANNAIKQ